MLQLGLPFDEIPVGSRSSIDGAISSEINFDDWFAKKDKAFQEEYLGAGRFDLYKKGKITFNQLVDQNGAILTIEELRKKYT